jgi:hypothetical protein
MYGALWRVLPGPWWIRVLLLALAALLVIAALFMWVFPLIDPLLGGESAPAVGAPPA